MHICDIETDRLRSATKADLAGRCHIVEAMGITSRSHPTFIPADVPIGSADVHAFTTILLNSQRPHTVSVYSAAMRPFFIEACRIANGSVEAVKQAPVFVTKVWVSSPFMPDRVNIDIGMEARRLLGVPPTYITGVRFCNYSESIFLETPTALLMATYTELRFQGKRV